MSSQSWVFVLLIAAARNPLFAGGIDAGYPYQCNQRRQEEGWTQPAVPQHAGGDEVDHADLPPSGSTEQQRPSARRSTAARILR